MTINRMFDPGPRTYTSLIDRLSRQLDVKYRDHFTVLSFALKATPPNSEEYEQDPLFETASVFVAPQEETLFPPGSTM